jgi:hypothetical protein
MTKKLSPFVVFTLLIVVVTGAAAQRNELAGIIGRTFISDQGVAGTGLPDSNIHFGNGLTFEANYSRRLLEAGVVAIEVEVPAIFDTSEKLHFGGFDAPSSFASYFVTPSARLHLFSDGGFSPWISVGGGVGHFAMNARLESGQPNPNKSGTTTGVFQVGLGLDVRIIHAVYLRGEVRELSSGEPALNVNTGKSRYYNLFAGAGLVFRF